MVFIFAPTEEVSVHMLILWATAGGPLALLCEMDISCRSEHRQVGECKHDNETNLLPILCPVTDLTSLDRQTPPSTEEPPKTRHHRRRNEIQ
jgi:hypothetical protein